jgi:phosphate butyryltransferase
MIHTFQEILDRAGQDGAKRIAVPFPGQRDMEVLSRAAGAGCIVPTLIGREKSLKNLIRKTPLASMDHEILDVPDRKEALGLAMAHVREGRADILMQGGMAHRPLIDAVLDKNHGLMKGKVASYASVFHSFRRDRLFLITDTFLNSHPDIVGKKAILENALHLSRMMGVEAPKVAVLAAIEQVNPAIPSTMDAAILAKMSDRGQFGRAMVEGPIDIDCAISEVAAHRKGLETNVTGNADIFLVPEIDTGHLLAEALVFFGKMPTAGVVMGTTKPVILDVAFVSDENRVAEIALACLLGRSGEEKE